MTRLRLNPRTRERSTLQLVGMADLEHPELRRACCACWDYGKEQGNISDTTRPSIDWVKVQILWYCRRHLPPGFQWIWHWSPV